MRRHQQVLAFALAAAALTTATAAASFPGLNGPIVYGWETTIDRDDFSEIHHVIRATPLGPSTSTVLFGCQVFTDATPEHEVEACKQSEYTSPAVSPDGRLVVFVANDRLGLVAADGGDPRLLPPRKNLATPRFSPDGRRLVFTAGSALWISDLDGTGPRRLTTGSAPDWSTRDRIAFVRRGQIFLIRPDGSGTRQVTRQGGWSPSWSPDGTRLAFAREGRYGGVYTVDADGSRRRQITTERGDDGLQAWGVRWSPDGRRLLVESSSLLEIGVRSRHVLREHFATEYSGATSQRQMYGYDWGPMPAPASSPALR